MGVFFYIHSVALIEDLALELHYENPNDFYLAADRAYAQVIVQTKYMCECFFCEIRFGFAKTTYQNWTFFF